VYHYAGNNPVKLVDPDGNIIRTPSRSLGINAHEEIIRYLMGSFGGRPQVYLPSPFKSNGTTKGAFFVDYSRKIGNTTEFYEIKPISYMSSTIGDEQLQNYIDRANSDARNKGIDETFVKGTSLLSKLNGAKIDTLMFQGPEVFDPTKPGSITLTTDPVNHPGMIFYTLDDGLPEGDRNKILEFLEDLLPNGLPFVIPAPAPLPLPIPAIP